jgi:hypothetical protein
MLFGVMGAVLAAPLTSACVNALTLLRDEGILAGSARPAADDSAEGFGDQPGSRDVPSVPSHQGIPEILETP